MTWTDVAGKRPVPLLHASHVHRHEVKEIDSRVGKISGMLILKPDFNVINAVFYMRLCTFSRIVSLVKRTMTLRSIRTHRCRLRHNVI